MKFISLFAGIGGFDLALERLGHECVYANDIDKYCKITYDRHFTNKLDCRSITDVSSSEIPDHDLLCGGFPCQSFSIVGRRRGFNDTRGTLFFEIARILQAKKPKYFILENVKGLLSHDNGNTFKTIIAALDELRYDLQWQVLNSKYFTGQNRERIYIFGHLRGQSRPEVFPIFATTEKHITKINNSPKSYMACLTTRSGLSRLAADMGFVYQKDGIRDLTPLERERFQGFPDGWTEGVSDTQRCKQLGNAVTVNVVYEIAKRISL